MTLSKNYLVCKTVEAKFEKKKKIHTFFIFLKYKVKDKKIERIIFANQANIPTPLLHFPN